MNPQLQFNNYLYVPNFLTAQEADGLAQEFFVAEREGRLNLDPQCPSSPAIYNFLPCVKVLVKKTQYVSELCGEDVLPTYAYGRIYKHGEILAKHIDRDACEISLTVNLQKDADWPIWVKKPDGTEVNFELQPGDAVLYLGCIADHWRNQFVGQNYVQMFIHYVRANGPKSYAFFDKAQ